MLERVLFFPVTPFTADDEVNREALAEHIDRGISAGAGGLFPACGTGEFHALDLDEYAAVVETSVAAAAGRVAVFVGAGGPAPVARRQAAIAESLGADGVLLLPPYLVAGPGEGVVRYVQQVAAATTLPVVVYHRGAAQFTERSALAVSEIPNVIGLKDGVGDIDLMARIVRTVGDATAAAGEEFLFFNGLPTAEVSQVAYRAIGVPLYSSASYAFAPDIALAYHDAVERQDAARVTLLERSFYHPLVRLRNTVPGYAVSLVKGAVTRFAGVDAGHVRAPYVDALPAHLDLVGEMLDRTRAALAAELATAGAPDPHATTRRTR